MKTPIASGWIITLYCPQEAQIFIQMNNIKNKILDKLSNESSAKISQTLLEIQNLKMTSKPYYVYSFLPWPWKTNLGVPAYQLGTMPWHPTPIIILKVSKNALIYYKSEIYINITNLNYIHHYTETAIKCLVEERTHKHKNA